MCMHEPTLLIIEDASDQAALVRVAARRAFPALDVRVAGDGQEGIAYLEGAAPFQDRGCHRFPHLVILDLLMPKIDGFGVLEWIRDRSIPSPLPVVVLTASTDPEHQRRAIMLGAEAVYIKPSDLNDLSVTVKEIVLRWIGVPRPVSPNLCRSMP